MALSKDDLLAMFRESGALLEGHFLLTSGLHSPQYFQCAKVLQYPKHLSELAGEIASHFAKARIDVVISPAIGGIVVGTEVGRLLGCRTIFAERSDGVMQIRRGFEILPNERLLAVEDVVTTGGSVQEVIALAKNAGAVIGGVGCIVDRSNGKVRFDVDQFAALRMDVITYTPETCPLCAAGGKPVKPGSRGNT